MRNFYLLSLIFFSCFMHAQNLGTDIEGFSTIYTEGSNLGLDVTNDQLSFDYYTSSYWEEKNQKTKKFFYGSSLKGEANDGIANLFSSGKINADASINLVFGIKTNKKIKKPQTSLKIAWLQINAKKLDTLINMGRGEALVKIFEIQQKKMINELGALLRNNPLVLKKMNIDLIRAKINALNYYNSDWTEINNDIKNLPNNLGDPINKLIEKFEVLKSNIENSGTYSEWENTILSFEVEFITGLTNSDKMEINNRLSSIKLIKKDYDSKIYEIRNLRKNLYPSNTNKWLFKLGVKGQEFKYDLDNGAETIEERFNDEEFTGLSFELIYNIQFNYKNFFGFSVRGERANNFNTLEAKEISLAEMVAEGETGTEETVNAFVGDYDTFNRYSFNADYMHFISLESKGDKNVYLSINPYLRHFIYENAAQLKNSTNLGIGFNFFNSTKNKVLGGAFIQANDIFGVQSEETIGKSIAFGLVLRYAFKGFDFKEKTD